MDKAKRGRYTPEFKLEAVRLVQAGQSVTATAQVLGISDKTLHSWVTLARKGQLIAPGAKPVSAEQMELARLRADNAKLRMERDILKKATAYFAKISG